jgi:ketosteroid isomerase-like protein
MKILILIVLSVVSTLATADKAYPKPQTPSDVHKLFIQYYDEKDMTGLLTLFHEDAVFIKNAEGEKARVRQMIEKVLNPYLEADGEFESGATSIHINGNFAMVKADWLLKGTDVHGTGLEVLEYRDGGWAYLIDNPNGY